MSTNSSNHGIASRTDLLRSIEMRKDHSSLTYYLAALRFGLQHESCRRGSSPVVSDGSCNDGLKQCSIKFGTEWNSSISRLDVPGHPHFHSKGALQWRHIALESSSSSIQADFAAPKHARDRRAAPDRKASRFSKGRAWHLQIATLRPRPQLMEISDRTP